MFWLSEVLYGNDGYFEDPDVLKIFHALIKEYKKDICKECLYAEADLADVDNLSEKICYDIALDYGFKEIEILNDWLERIPLATVMIYNLYGVRGLIKKLQDQPTPADVRQDPLYDLLLKHGFDAVDAMQYMEYNPNSSLIDYSINDPDDEFENVSWAPFPTYEEEDYFQSNGDYLNKWRLMQLRLLKEEVLKKEFAVAYKRSLDNQTNSNINYNFKYVSPDECYINYTTRCKNLYLLMLEILEQQNRLLNKHLDKMPKILQLRYLITKLVRPYPEDLREIEQELEQYRDLGFTLVSSLSSYLENKHMKFKDPLKLLIRDQDYSIQKLAEKYKRITSLRRVNPHVYFYLSRGLFEHFTWPERTYGVDKL